MPWMQLRVFNNLTYSTTLSHPWIFCSGVQFKFMLATWTMFSIHLQPWPLLVLPCWLDFRHGFPSPYLCNDGWAAGRTCPSVALYPGSGCSAWACSDCIWGGQLSPMAKLGHPLVMPCPPFWRNSSPDDLWLLTPFPWKLGLLHI